MLTKENYYSKEMNARYMSVSSFKSIMECEAKYIAEQDGSYERPDSKALIVGNYVHTAFDSESEWIKFIEDNHQSIFQKNGKKYADFVQADKMIETLKDDALCMEFLEGDKEVIMTGHLYGMDWKIRIDNLNLEKGFFSDIKTTKGLYDRYWSDKFGAYVSFIQKYDYILQMYIYMGVIYQNTNISLNPFIVAVTKETSPDKSIIKIDNDRYRMEHEYLKNNADRVRQVWKREVEPKRCEKCDYCRKTKVLDGSNIIEVSQLLL